MVSCIRYDLLGVPISVYLYSDSFPRQTKSKKLTARILRHRPI